MTAIGLRLPDETYGYSIAETTELARTAERQGYHSVWAPELQGPNGFMILGHIATETSTIGLGTGIVNVYSRTPALLAMSVATLDELSAGRAILGLAASSEDAIEGWHSVEYDQPLRRLRETIEIIRLALRDERIDYHGAIFDIEDYPRSFEPLREDVPIYNAALGPANQRLTGAFADGWLPIHVPKDRIGDCIERIHESARDAGRDPDTVTIAPYIVGCVDEDPDRARDYVQALLSFYLGAMAYYGRVFSEFGYGDEVEAIREAWNSGDREEAADRVTDDLVDSVAICGTPDEGREQLREYRTLGVDLPIVYPPDAPREVIETTVTELASY